MFKDSKVGKFLSVIGLRPVTDLIAGSTGIISALKEGKDPSSKISARRSAASVMLFAGITMISTADYSTPEIKIKMVMAGVLVVCGSFLLALTTFNKK